MLASSSPRRRDLLEQAGFRFTIEADMGHDVWARVYAGRDVYDWLLQHRARTGVAQGAPK